MTINNSDLELAGGFIQLEALAQTFHMRERTVLSQGDDLNATFREQQVSTTYNLPPSYLLCMFGIHQRCHRYIPRFDYIVGPSNHITDALSMDFHVLWDKQFSQ